MIIGTVAWYWKGQIELALILCAWGIWVEAVALNSKLFFKVIPKNKTDKE